MTASDSAVTFNGVSKTYRRGQGRSRLRAAVPGEWGGRFRGASHQALEDVTCSVARGSSFGLIGANGAGKSTMLKLIASITSPSSGSVTVTGPVAALIELGAGLHQDMTGRENISFLASVLGMKRRELSSRLDQIIEFAGIDSYLDTPVKRYSSGMVARLGFAVASHLDAEILLLDEVLSVGDARFQRRCHERVQELRKDGCTTIYVTHALWTLPLLCDRAAVLENGRLLATGTPAIMIDVYQQRVVAPTEPSTSVHLTLDEHELQTGHQLGIVVTLRPSERVEQPYVLLSITDLQGTVLSGWRVPSDRSCSPEAPVSLRFELPELWLRPGRYQVNACLTRGPTDTVAESLVSQNLEVLGEQHNRSAFGQFVVPAAWSWYEPPHST